MVAPFITLGWPGSNAGGGSVRFGGCVPGRRQRPESSGFASGLRESLDARPNLFMGEVFAALELTQPNLDLPLEPLLLVEAYNKHLAGEVGRRLPVAGGITGG